LDVPWTVSVVLPVLPEASVAVMVVVPGLLPVARPVASMVATAVLLLVHVNAVVPCIVTGVRELVVVPLPNWPHSFDPQQRTVPLPRRPQL
jgi:hypothetical protein